MSLVRFDNVHKTFGPLEVLKGMSFEIPEGQFVLLLGPNGVGKTSTVRLLAGVIKPTSGRIELFGGDPTGPEAHRLREKLSVQTTDTLYTQLSPYQNLDIWAEIYGIPAAKRRDRIVEVLTLFGLETRQEQPISYFSKGMRQKLLLARALLNEPELLILDEPTSGLDPLMADRLLIHLSELQKRLGTTILMCTHRLEMVDEIVDHVMILNKGRLVVQKSIEEVANAESTVRDILVQPGSLNLGALKNLNLSLVGIQSEAEHYRLKVDTVAALPEAIQALSAEGKILAIERVKGTVRALYTEVMQSNEEPKEAV